MAIQNDAETLKTRIITALEATTLKDGKIEINQETGAVTKSDQTPALKHPDAVPNISINARKPTYQLVYSTGDQVGIDALIEIIVRETLSYLIEKVEIIFKDRIDNHSTMFDTLITTLTTQLATFPSAQPQVPVTNAQMNTFLAALNVVLVQNKVEREIIKAQEVAQGTEIK